MALPKRLHQLFWDYDAAALGWPSDRELITSRILASGDWDSVKWLMGRATKSELRRFLVKRRGRGLEPRQLRFWELVLEIPREEVNRWLGAMAGNPLHGRRRK